MTLEPQLLNEMYRRMVTIRTFDRLAVEEFHSEEAVREAVEFAKNSPMPKPEDALLDVFAS